MLKRLRASAICSSSRCAARPACAPHQTKRSLAVSWRRPGSAKSRTSAGPPAGSEPRLHDAGIWTVNQPGSDQGSHEAAERQPIPQDASSPYSAQQTWRSSICRRSTTACRPRPANTIKPTAAMNKKGPARPDGPSPMQSNTLTETTPMASGPGLASCFWGLEKDSLGFGV